jgi:ribose transport system substrate-binding protein
MKTMKKLCVALMVVLMFVTGIFAGCTVQENEETKGEGSTQESDESADTSSDASTDMGNDEALGDDEQELKNHEIYKRVADAKLSLQGIMNPWMDDRKDINKGWPHEVKNEQLLIGVTQSSLNNDWLVNFKSGIEEEAAKLGFKVNYLLCDNDPQVQSQDFDTFITQGVDVIVIVPAASNAFNEDVRKVAEAGIPVIGSVAGNDPSVPLLCSFAYDTYYSAYGVAKELGKQFKPDEKITIGNIVGYFGTATCESRVGGMISGLLMSRKAQKDEYYKFQEDCWLEGDNLLEEYKSAGKLSIPEINVECVGMFESKWIPAEAILAVEDLLQAHPEVNAIMCEDGAVWEGVAKALKDMGRTDIKLIAAGNGWDSQKKAITDANLVACGVMEDYLHGKYTVDFIDYIFNKGGDPSNMPIRQPLGTFIVNAETVNEATGLEASLYNDDGSIIPLPSIDEIKAGASTRVQESMDLAAKGE